MGCSDFNAKLLAKPDQYSVQLNMAAKNESELHALLKNAFNELARSKPRTMERTNALTSIENIQREITSRAPCP